MFYKHSDRKTFSLALVNCCLSVHLSDDNQVEYLRMCFGGIGKHAIVRHITPKADNRLVILAFHYFNAPVQYAGT